MGTDSHSQISPFRRLHGHAGNAPGNGPYLDVTLVIGEGAVHEANYETYQCPGCHACGKALCDLVSGKSIEDARQITHPMLVERVGPLPKYRQICYGLALLALDDALKQLEKD